MKEEFGNTPENINEGLSELQTRMVEEAKIKYKDITPVSHREKWKQCFTVENGEMLFWFNTKDESTQVLRESEKPD